MPYKTRGPSDQKKYETRKQISEFRSRDVTHFPFHPRHTWDPVSLSPKGGLD